MPAPSVSALTPTAKLENGRDERCSFNARVVGIERMESGSPYGSMRDPIGSLLDEKLRFDRLAIDRLGVESASNWVVARTVCAKRLEPRSAHGIMNAAKIFLGSMSGTFIRPHRARVFVMLFRNTSPE